MKTRLILLAIASIVLFASCNAGRGYEIKVTSPNVMNDTLRLALYTMGSLMNKDSVILDSKGKGILKGKEPLKQGNYVLYLSDGTYTDVIIGTDQRFSVQLDTLDMPYNVRFKGARQTEDFYDYSMLFFRNKSKVQKLGEQAQTATEEERNEIMSEMEAITKKVQDVKDSLVKVYDGEMTAVFLKGYDMVTPPEFETSENYYAFFRDHFFDNIDLADERSYHTPYIRQRIDTYLNKVLVQTYDSIIPNAIRLCDASAANDSAFKIMTSYMLRYATNYDIPGFLDMRHIMGIDNLIVELADRYYLNGRAFWADSTQIASLKKKADKIRYCQIGKPAVNIPIANIAGEYDSLYNKCGTVFTVLVFYEPDCGHCQKRLPIIADFYKQYENDERINVIAFCMKDTKNEWLDFIKTYNTGNLINVWDPERKSNYWTNFDTSETPMIYILDADRRIEAKNLEPEQLYGVAAYKMRNEK